MTIPTTNVSLLDVQNEFGGAAPTGLNEYYVGGGLVVAGQYTTTLGNPPSSGPISLADFRGVSKVTDFVFNATISANRSVAFNLYSEAISAGWNGTSKLIATITIDAGVVLTSSFTSVGAFNIGSTTYPTGSTCTLINNGTIAGLGGQGGTGGTVSGTTLTAPTAGSNGGPGISLNNVGLMVNVYNYGTIGGGGGGGGGGGSGYWSTTTGGKNPVAQLRGANGAGGGGGRANGAAGFNGVVPTSVDVAVITPTGPSAGTFTDPGAGGTGGSNGIIGGFGGTGGALGQSGSPGTQVSGSFTNRTGAGAGGLPGYSVSGGQYVNWYVFGTRSNLPDNPGNNFTGSAVNDHADQSLSDACSSLGCNSSVWVNFYTDGDERGFAQGNVLQFNTSWYSPELAGIGASHWIRADVVVGTIPTGDVLGTWLPLTAVRSWGYYTNSGILDGTIRVRIASDSGGSNVLFDVNYNMSAEGGGF